MSLISTEIAPDRFRRNLPDLIPVSETLFPLRQDAGLPFLACIITPMRKSDWALISLTCLATLFMLTFVDAGIRQRLTAEPPGRALVSELGLTDLCLFTEARYTRHLSQADWHTPFQDHPAALEHFPSGSLAPPPYESFARAAARPH